MVTLHEGKHYIVNNDHIATAEEAAKLSAEEGKKQTLTYQVLEKPTTIPTTWSIWKSNLIPWVFTITPM
ncbi:MAG: hypothetical protein V8S58_02600 [Lachnospiraceae bacterium]